MRATVERSHLLKSLGHVHRVVERRNTIPILSNVLVKAGRSRFSLQVLPEADFPDLTAGDFPTRFRLKAGEFKKLIDRTQFAISTEETRYYLNGIYLHVVTVGEKPMLRAVATDGHRLAQAQIDAPEGTKGMAGVIVPRKTVGEVQKLLDDPEAEAEIELSDTKIRVTIGTVVLTSKLIDGTFPDYVRVIPQGNDKVLKVDKGEFAAAVDRVSTVSSERGRAVKIALSEGKMVLSVNNPDSGSATEEIGVDYAADPIEIGFNSKYLLDVTQQLANETAEFRFADPGSPTLIQDDDAGNALFVLMPMRV